jgi:hypothetical protein
MSDVPNEQDQLPATPRVIDVRGELEITIYKSITKDKQDTYSQCEFLVNISIDGQNREGVVVLDLKRTKKLLALLNLEGV